MKPSKDREARRRSKKTAAGLYEVRGIWLPKVLHPKLKEQAKRLAEDVT